MTHEIDAQGRLQFLQIEEQDRHALVAFRPVLVGAIDHILDAFYAHAASHPTVGAFFDGRQVDHARQQQKHHWLENIFSGKFDDAYFAQVQRIGMTHARIGLEPRWYIAGYCLALNRIVALANATYHKRPQLRDQVVDAINKAVFLDMDLAVSVYFQEIKNQTAQTLQQRGDTFEGHVVQTVGQVVQAITDLEKTAQEMDSIAQTAKDRAGSVAAAAQVASSNVDTVASATEQLSASITEINRQVAHSSNITGQAVDEAERADKIIASLSEAAQRIGDVVSMISDIARRTNMLALNATIEAARAGDAGKGFAVVAVEVKNLANQTARATGEITDQIAAVQKASRNAVDAINGINDIIREMSGISHAIAAAVEEQGFASQEISRSISETAAGTQIVTDEIVHVDKANIQTSDAAHGVLASAQQLTTQSNHLLGQVREFVVSLRS